VVSEAPDPGPRTSIVERDYPLSYLRVMKKLGDMYHVPFVHRATIPATRARVEIQEARLDGVIVL
jgi:phenylpropionate dioxygenase-like ring-hydroxylating dioxygenase large terminal subunit